MAFTWKRKGVPARRDPAGSRILAAESQPGGSRRFASSVISMPWGRHRLHPAVAALRLAELRNDMPGSSRLQRLFLTSGLRRRFIKWSARSCFGRLPDGLPKAAHDPDRNGNAEDEARCHDSEHDPRRPWIPLEDRNPSHEPTARDRHRDKADERDQHEAREQLEFASPPLT